VNQLKFGAGTCSLNKGREKVHEPVAIGFGFSSDRMRKWREIFKPITTPSNVKTKAEAN